MECVYFDAREDRLTLKATDTELAIITSVDANVTDEGAFLVPLKTLYDLVRTFPPERVFFDIDEISYNINIACAQLEVSLLAQDASAFPVIDRLSAQEMLTMENETFREIVRESVFCCAPSLSVNPVITGVNIELSEDSIICTALDGYKMSVRKQELSGNTVTDPGFIVSGRIMNEILKILSLYTEDISFGVSNNRFVINVGSTQIMSILIEGPFINYRALIPQTINTVVKVNKNDLMRAIERAGYMTGSVANSMVKFVISDDRLNLSCSSSIGAINESITVAKTGNDIKIAFNVRYFAELIRNIKDEKIILEFKDSNSPCLIKPVDDDRFTFLVMPVRYIE